MSVRKVQALGALIVVSLLTACGEHGDFRPGPMRTETLQVDAFEAIDMRGDGRLEIQVGAAESVTLEGREAALEQTDVEVRAGTLHISTRGRKVLFWGDGSQNLTVRVSVPRLSSLRLRGGNDVQLEGFAGGESNFHVEGAAHIKAAGRLEALDVRMAGAGHADLADLTVNHARVSVDGVGSVRVHSTESLDATMNGVGAILYSGSPRDVKTRMNGLGTISQHDDRQEKDRRRDWNWRDRGSDGARGEERERRGSQSEVI